MDHKLSLALFGIVFFFFFFFPIQIFMLLILTTFHVSHLIMIVLREVK